MVLRALIYLVTHLSIYIYIYIDICIYINRYTVYTLLVLVFNTTDNNDTTTNTTKNATTHYIKNSPQLRSRNPAPEYNPTLNLTPIVTHIIPLPSLTLKLPLTIF